jgi:hypothetical protein
MRVLAALTIASATLLSFEAKSLDLRERPVSKVIKLLKDMKAELESEHKKDQELFDQMECWCETNEKEKTAAVGTANRRIDSLQATIGKLSGKTGELEATIAQTEKELAANTAALKQATDVRAKEAAEFNSEEKDVIQSLQAMKNAVGVLSKHHSEFLQKAAHTAVKQVMEQKIGDAHRAKLNAAVSQPGLTNSGSYAPASGQIFGILNQMKDEFESNLAKMQEEEKTGASDFAGLKSAKSTEIAANKKMSKDKTAELAETEDNLAKAKEDLDLTREALSSDTKFIQELRLRCQQSDNDWELRSKTRLEEIAAVSETVKILSDDDAHDLFAKSVNSFVQISESSATQVRAREVVSAKLRSMAKKSKNLQLLALSQMVKQDPFGKLKGVIDDMSSALKTQMGDEVKERDYCVREFNENDMKNQQKQREMKQLTSLIDTSKATMDSLDKEMDQLRADIKEMQVQMQKASEAREAENHEFQIVVTDQRATQNILKKALARLEVFYGKKTLIQLTAEPGAAAPPPPPAMSEMKPSQGAGGVMQLIQNVIDESATMEKESLTAEEEAQAGYEDFMTNSNAAISNANKQITAKTDEKSETEDTKIGAEGDLNAALDDAEALAKYKSELHGSCDFLMKNFGLRQQSMTNEIEGLGEAKATLSGADLR